MRFFEIILSNFEIFFMIFFFNITRKPRGRMFHLDNVREKFFGAMNGPPKNDFCKNISNKNLKNEFRIEKHDLELNFVEK